ncbi:hypothetical protein SARC_15514, partial [Sphaeroforma arctica JP610]
MVLILALDILLCVTGTPTWRDIAQRTINCDSSAFSFDDTQPEKEEKKSPISSTRELHIVCIIGVNVGSGDAAE